VDWAGWAVVVVLVSCWVAVEAVVAMLLTDSWEEEMTMVSEAEAETCSDWAVSGLLLT
jgi:hypothetical protein